MSSSENIKASIGSVIEGMDQFISSKTVVGDPIYIDDTVIIPLVSVSFGMGVGATGQKDNQAGAMGGKVTPNSIIVIHNGVTRLMNISTHSGMDRLLDLVPDFVDRFTTSRKDKKEKATQEGTSKSLAKDLAVEAGEEMIEKDIKKSARDRAAKSLRKKISRRD